MIKRIMSLACLGLLIFAQPAMAANDIRHIDKATVRHLLNWVEAQMNARAPSLPVVMASENRFSMVMEMAGVYFADARALYIPGTVIIGDNDWNARDPEDVSLVVHELVHHVQMFNKRHYPCANAKEYEAYTLQNLWLTSQGYRPFASQNWINQMANCNSSDY